MRACLVLSLLAILVLADPAGANSRLGNVVMEVDPRGRATTTVTNMGSVPMGYQLTPLEWTVVDGEDVYRATSQFMAVPPQFRLAPGQTMTVRVGLRNPSPARVERAWRLSVREVPARTGGEGIVMAFNHLLAVYVAPHGGIQPRNVNWSLRRTGNGWAVRISNNGNRRQVIQSLTVGGRQIDTRAHSTVLSGSWRQFPVPAGAVQGGSAQLEVRYLTGGSESVTARGG